MPHNEPQGWPPSPLFVFTLSALGASADLFGPACQLACLLVVSLSCLRGVSSGRVRVGFWSGSWALALPPLFGSVCAMLQFLNSHPLLLFLVIRSASLLGFVHLSILSSGGHVCLVLYLFMQPCMFRWFVFFRPCARDAGSSFGPFFVRLFHRFFVQSG